MRYYVERKYKVSGMVIILSFIILSLLQFWQINARNNIVRTMFTEYHMMAIIWGFGILLYLRFAPKMHSSGRFTQLDHINFEALAFAIAYFGARYLTGILIYELGKSPYSFTLPGITNNILNVVPQLVAKELVRFHLINTYCKKKKIAFIFYGLSILFVACDFNWNLIKTVEDFETLSKLLAKDVLPTVCLSLLLSFLALYGGITTSIIYVLSSFVFVWLVPILPSLNWFSEGVLGTIIPLIAISYITTKHNRKNHREKEMSLKDQVGMGFMLACSVLLIWFVVGVFPIYPSVIATGSMEPMIYPGDIILIDQIKEQADINLLEAGDVIQFKRDDILITHRIVAAEKDPKGKLVFRTKGDNNSAEDSRLVYPEEIRGTLVKVIPKLGYPTLLIKERNNTNMDEIDF